MALMSLSSITLVLKETFSTWFSNRISGSRANSIDVFVMDR